MNTEGNSPRDSLLNSTPGPGVFAYQPHEADTQSAINTAGRKVTQPISKQTSSEPHGTKSVSSTEAPFSLDRSTHRQASDEPLGSKTLPPKQAPIFLAGNTHKQASAVSPSSKTMPLFSLVNTQNQSSAETNGLVSSQSKEARSSNTTSPTDSSTLSISSKVAATASRKVTEEAPKDVAIKYCNKTTVKIESSSAPKSDAGAKISVRAENIKVNENSNSTSSSVKKNIVNLTTKSEKIPIAANAGNNIQMKKTKGGEFGVPGSSVGSHTSIEPTPETSMSSSSTGTDSSTKRVPENTHQKNSSQKPVASKSANNAAPRSSTFFNSVLSQSISLKRLNIANMTTVLSLEQARDFFPWVGMFHHDNQYLHPSLPYLAVVYNETGGWSKEQLLLLATNKDLATQVNWEIRVALLFRKFNSQVRSNLLRELLSLPKDEALSIIALKTAEQAFEVILAPSPGSDLLGLKASDIISLVQKWAESAADMVESKAKEAEGRFSDIKAHFERFKADEKHAWLLLSDQDKELVRDLANAKILMWQVQNFSVRVCSYSGFIHAKTTRWDHHLDKFELPYFLASCAPIMNQFKTIELSKAFPNDRQYGNFQKFLQSIYLVVQVKGVTRPLVLHSIDHAQTFVPFELFFHHEQKSQTGNFMRTVMGVKASFYFTSPPCATNKISSLWSVEGILDAGLLNPKHGSFLADPLTLCMSEFGKLCKFCFDKHPNCFKISAAILENPILSL